MSPVQVSNPNDDNIMSRKFVREKRLMDSITLLSDGTDNDRIDAANDIVKLLISKQNEVCFYNLNFERYLILNILHFL